MTDLPVTSSQLRFSGGTRWGAQTLFGGFYPHLDQGRQGWWVEDEAAPRRVASKISFPGAPACPG